MKKHLDCCPACNSPLEIASYCCKECDITVEGHFCGCEFCGLGDDDRLFALVFLQTEGNMKDVERLMGISYPTIKAKLARLNNSLGVQLIPEKKPRIQPAGNEIRIDAHERASILDRLQKKEITAAEAAKLLRGETIADKAGDDKGDDNE
jgi:hypothetical protein